MGLNEISRSNGFTCELWWTFTTEVVQKVCASCVFETGRAQTFIFLLKKKDKNWLKEKRFWAQRSPWFSQLHVITSAQIVDCLSKNILNGSGLTNSQSGPSQPDWHSQKYVPSPSTHCAPFWQLCAAHSSMSISQTVPGSTEYLHVPRTYRFCCWDLGDLHECVQFWSINLVWGWYNNYTHSQRDREMTSVKC